MGVPDVEAPSVTVTSIAATRRLAGVFLRALAMVTLVAWNTRQIAAGRYWHAIVIGGLISYVWWRNAGKASADRSHVAAVCYGVGASCGTALGMWLGR